MLILFRLLDYENDPQEKALELLRQQLDAVQYVSEALKKREVLYQQQVAQLKKELENERKERSSLEATVKEMLRVQEILLQKLLKVCGLKSRAGQPEEEEEEVPGEERDGRKETEEDPADSWRNF